MTRLATILAHLLAQAQPGQPIPSTRLSSGLRVSARVLSSGQRQMSLTRTASVRPSVKEAEVCRDHAGWALASIEAGETRGGLPCLLVTEGGGG